MSALERPPAESERVRVEREKEGETDRETESEGCWGERVWRLKEIAAHHVRAREAGGASHSDGAVVF